jgi:hypothetical protein
MANLRLIIQSSDPASVLTAQLNALPAAGGRLDFFKKYIDYIRTGQRAGSIAYLMASEVAASGTAQCATVVANDTITIGSKTLTGKASPATQDQFNIGSSDLTCAANLAACINANTDLNTWLSAVSDGVDTVTITCLVPGKQGNSIPLSSSGSTIVVSGSFLSSGADGVFRKEVL